MRATPTPTKSELTLLRTLWTRGPSTVREIHEALAPSRAVGYTTTLKVLQVMTAKGLVVREMRGTQHLYRARHPETQMQRRLVKELVDRAFGGSTSQLVLQALATRRASADELREIRELIASAEEKAHDKRPRE
jgi:BlaI family penicillinase repressor